MGRNRSRNGSGRCFLPDIVLYRRCSTASRWTAYLIGCLFISFVTRSAWTTSSAPSICADCQEGNPPEDCEYYGEPRGCNAPTYGGPPPRYYEELREENKRLRAAHNRAARATRAAKE